MWNFGWGDLWGGLSALGGLANTGMNMYSMFNQPSTPSWWSQPPPQQGMWGGFDPGRGSGGMEGEMPFMPFEMPDFSQMFAGYNDILAKQQALMTQNQQKGMARDAASTRRQLQSQGVYGEPGANVGAAGSDAVASILGLSPEELMKALKGFGSEFGWEV